MATRVALVSCVKSKQKSRVVARDLYISPLFRGMRRYAEQNAEAWFILSAKHGVVHPNQVIGPYERTLKTMPKPDRVAWAQRVQRHLLELLPVGAEVVVLAGERYREAVVPFLKDHGFAVEVPMNGLRFGLQLRWLNERCAMSDPRTDLARFYTLLSKLEASGRQGLRLDAYTGRSPFPARGVYFFRESGEYRLPRSNALRIVRVGTHAVSANSKSTLWGRLKAHLGTRKGGGNHRGSIFRLHVGAALLARDGVHVPTWGIGRSAPPAVRASVAAQDAEAAQERKVSEYIGAMTVLWVDVPDEPGRDSMRAFIERNAIALLSNRLAPTEPASADWLGHHSPQDNIRRSSLWNLNHVDQKYDPSFLDELETAVERTVKPS